MTKAQEAEKREAIEELRQLVKPGDTLYTILRHVSRSGMSRVIDVLVMGEGCEPRSIAFQAHKALGEPLDRDRWGVKVGGCGMDMGFHVVYNLSYTLFPKGHECAGERCPSNDHSNYRSQEVPKHHNDGGYALRQRWL